MCWKFMPYTPAISVGTVISAPQAASFFVTSPSARLISVIDTEIAVCSISRRFSTAALSRARWS